MKTRLLLAALALFAPAAAQAQAAPRPAAPAAPANAAADSAAIRRAALDYIEGWYTGDAARMERALHPDLSKRSVVTDREGRNWLDDSGADGLIRATRIGYGGDVPAERRWTHVEILDLDGDLASVKLSSTKLVDYMHLARWDGGWRIVNVLWAGRPEDRPRP